MRLCVQNLGPVREAELDLDKPLIVLTGPNNSGKTYLAWAAYSLSRVPASAVPASREIRDWTSNVLSTRGSLKLDALLGLSDGVCKGIADAVRQRLHDDFAAPRERFAATTISLRVEDSDFLEVSPGFPTSVSRRGDEVFLAFPAGEELVVGNLVAPSDGGANFREIDIPDVSGQERETMAARLPEVSTSFLATMLTPTGYVAFPVERLAINLFARELAAERTELVDELLHAASDSPNGSGRLHEMLRRRAGRYPLVVRDALQTAIRPRDKNNLSPFADLADELETTVLGGSINLGTDDDLRFVPQGSDGGSLRLHESASVVKSLVSLVLHLRYDAAPGQRLLIDEPELNLHPDSQRRVARLLAKAINRGLKIMMSTHSDYVVRELNNLIMLGQDTDEARALIDELNYDPETTLKAEQVGAYLVHEGECKSLPITETGFEIKTIEDEIHQLNQDAQKIYLRLFCD